MKTLVAVLIFSLLLSVLAYAQDKGGVQAQIKEVRKIEHAKPAIPRIKQTVPQKLPKPPKQVSAPPKVTQPFVGAAKLPPGLAKREELPAGLAKKGKTPAGWDKGQKKGWIEQGAEEENPEAAKSEVASDETVTGKSSYENEFGKQKKEKVEKVRKEKGEKNK